MPVALHRFDVLPREAKHLVDGWLERAWQARDCLEKESFEPFIYCWIAFNSWGACVTEEDTDREMIKALKEDQSLNELFTDRTKNKRDQLAEFTAQFQTLWPIFKVQELRRIGVRQQNSGERSQIVMEYMANGAESYEPKDAVSPNAIGRQIPLTWHHTLSAIYRVRCNLFHGEKNVTSEMDQRVVGSAFRVLVHFFHDVIHPES